MAYNNIKYFEGVSQERFDDNEMLAYYSAARNGDEVAKEIFFECALNLVKMLIVTDFRRVPNIYTVIDFDDLASIGAMGLFKAFNSYNSERGQFSSFAITCIKREILMAIRKESAVGKRLLPLELTDSTIRTGGLISHLSNANSGVELKCIRDEEYKDTMGLLRDLPEKDRQIMEGFLGITRDEPMTGKEIGERVGCSQSYASRVKKRVLSDLQPAIEYIYRN